MSSKVAFVAGGTRRIGRWVSEALLVEGYHVAAAYQIQDKAAQQFQAEMKAAGYGLGLIKADVTNPLAAKSAVSEIAAEAGGLDVLAVCCGAATSGSIIATPPDELERIWRSNILAVHNLVAAATPYLRQSQGRVIAFLSAGAGSAKAYQDVPVYGACKEMLASYLRSLAKEMASSGVTVNAIAPGITELPQEGAPGIDADSLPIGKPVTQEDIASAVWYLISPASSQVTGTIIQVSGGFGI